MIVVMQALAEMEANFSLATDFSVACMQTPLTLLSVRVSGDMAL